MTGDEVADDLASRFEQIFGDDGHRTLEAIADEAGVPVEAMVATRRALGLTAELGSPIYGDALEEHARRLGFALAMGVPLDVFLVFNRVMARTTTALVEAAGELIVNVMGDRNATSPERRALEASELVSQLTPKLERMLGYAFREHAREMSRRETGALLSNEPRADLRDVAIGFADLVGYTRLGDQVTPERLTTVAVRLEQITVARLPPDVQLVKTIGDAVMLVSPDPATLTTTLLDLIEAADDEGPEYLRLRAGVAYGPAVRRAGDWYGAPVNLASRLAAIADPGRLAVTTTVASLTPTVPWVDVGTKQVRGIGQPVGVCVATPPALPGRSAPRSRDGGAIS